MTHFCIKRWIFDSLIFADHAKIVAYTKQVLRLLFSSPNILIKGLQPLP